jgi:hypothetical protein
MKVYFVCFALFGIVSARYVFHFVGGERLASFTELFLIDLIFIAPMHALSFQNIHTRKKF